MTDEVLLRFFNLSERKKIKVLKNLIDDESKETKDAIKYEILLNRIPFVIRLHKSDNSLMQEDKYAFLNNGKIELWDSIKLVKKTKHDKYGQEPSFVFYRIDPNTTEKGTMKAIDQFLWYSYDKFLSLLAFFKAQRNNKYSYQLLNGEKLLEYLIDIVLLTDCCHFKYSVKK